MNNKMSKEKSGGIITVAVRVQDVWICAPPHRAVNGSIQTLHGQQVLGAN